MIAVSMVVAIVMALRKVSWGTNRPTNEAAAIFGKSPLPTISLGVNMERSQNRADAPSALSVNRTIGETAAELAISLQNTMFSPNIV